MINLKEIWMKEENYAFSGWDFSHLNGRQEYDPLPWDYRTEAVKDLAPAHHLLDMGTGGGEFLMTLGHPCENTAVTEGYPPNLALCREKLAPLGVQVVGADGEDALPFANETFDRVINRHESYIPSEVFRILKPGGRFVTQQVGGKNCFDLRERLGFVVPENQFDLEHEIAQFESAGFRILRAEEHFNKLRFFDAGAVVFHAKIIQWEFPGFSVEKNWDQLMDIQREIEACGCIECTEHRFFIAAKKEI